jgi:hypothetical protein
MSMIKLSEMYLILAESWYYNGGGDYMSAFNVINQVRGVPLLTEIPDLNERLILEYRKEFFTEGQLFFLYKRLNMPNIRGVGSDINMIDVKAYTFPLPDGELRAAIRLPNR